MFHFNVGIIEAVAIFSWHVKEMKSTKEDYYFIVIFEGSIYLAFWHEKEWYYIHEQRGSQSDSVQSIQDQDGHTQGGGETLWKI